jgi:hypothetical protein
VAAEVNDIHVALVVAAHVQSRVVVTVSVLVAPTEGTAPDIALATETSHFGEDGAVMSMDVGPPLQATASVTNAHAPYSRARIAVRLAASGLPGA